MKRFGYQTASPTGNVADTPSLMTRTVFHLQTVNHSRAGEKHPASFLAKEDCSQEADDLRDDNEIDSQTPD